MTTLDQRELLRRPPDRRPERCEVCGAFVVLDAEDMAWQEIVCSCALRELRRGHPRERWCYTELHTAERCRATRDHRGPLPELEIP